MRKSRKSLYLHSSILRGRYLKEDGEQGGGATPAGGGDNAAGGQGNSNPGATGESGANNTGEGFDPATFWTGPDQGGSGAPSGESATGTTPGSGTGNDGNDLQTSLTTQLQSLSFGDPVFDATIAEQINAGDFTGVQKRLDASMQTAVRQSMSMNVQILRPFAEQLMNQMREEFGATLNGRDNNDTLVRDFPSAKDPRVAPIVSSIFSQALKNTKGNRDLAVSQTKEMLRLAAGTTAGDLGIEINPRGESDSGRQNPTINWLDELTSR